MNKLSLLLVVILLVIPFTSCSEDIDYNALIAGAMKPTNDKVAVLEQARGTLETRVKAVEDGKASIEFVNNKVSGLTAPNLSSYYTSAQVDAAIKKALDDYKATIVGGTSTPSNPSGVTGQVSWQITGTTQQQYQFNPSNMFTIRVINNSSASKYIRPQISVKSYQSMSAGTINPISTNCTVISNSMGQIAPIFTSTLLGIAGNHNGVIFQAYTGGIANGQYFLGSGQVMDFTVNIAINSTQSILWTIDLAGSSDSITQ